MFIIKLKMTSSSTPVKTSPQDTQVNRGQAAAGDQSLHAWLKEWRDRETMRILCCKEASPDEIQMMFTKLKEREEAFEKCLHALQHADPPKQPVEEPDAMISAFFQSHKAKNSKWAACPSCGCRYQTHMQHDCMKALNRRINKLQEALYEQ